MNKELPLFALFAVSQVASAQQSLPVIHDVSDAGYEQGVSAMFAGTSGGQIIVAGGCNFPDVPVAQGGKKRFYDGIYTLPITEHYEGVWQRIGSLPKPLAYGAMVMWQDRLICIGGQNSEGGSTDVFSICYADSLIIELLPSLPVPVDNAYAALLGDDIYLVGGNADGNASAMLYHLSLTALDAGWQIAAQLPDGPRVQPVLAAAQGKLFLWGGFCPKQGDKEAYIATTGWSYSPDAGQWTQIAAPPAFVGGGCALTFGDEIYCIGGVNADIFQRAIRGEYPNPEYQLHEPAWYRFNRSLQCYDVKTGLWSTLAESESFARAGAGLVALPSSFIVIQGEIKPGIRTPQMTEQKLKQ